jgi:hypothetical protein
VARTAVRAENKHGLQHPRQVEAVLLKEGITPVTGNAGRVVFQRFISYIVTLNKVKGLAAV